MPKLCLHTPAIDIYLMRCSGCEVFGNTAFTTRSTHRALLCCCAQRSSKFGVRSTIRCIFPCPLGIDSPHDDGHMSSFARPPSGIGGIEGLSRMRCCTTMFSLCDASGTRVSKRRLGLVFIVVQSLLRETVEAMLQPHHEFPCPVFMVAGPVPPPSSSAGVTASHTEE